MKLPINQCSTHTTLLVNEPKSFLYTLATDVHNLGITGNVEQIMGALNEEERATFVRLTKRVHLDRSGMTENCSENLVQLEQLH
ncbi:hypothetical protein KIN20_008773 [Parelaphostrongylus tenuis]|uniref:Uncharacterized protein n=1 Tax=Parelaphostrongylus tenuis TaxID=148309 RepID=A0AAD5MA77_PARTN|nr:hypothetical protein KIN20_008773 [Parelaphostrongylus tenuis]